MSPPPRPAEPADAVAALRDALAGALTLTPLAGGPTPLGSLLAALRQRAGGAASRAAPRRTRTLYGFRLDGRIDGFLALVTLCASAGHGGGWDGRRLLDDPRRFPALLAAADAVTDARRFARCYRALLESYFAYPLDGADATPEGRRQHAGLGRFLAAHLARAAAGSRIPEWAGCLSAHAHLLHGPGAAGPVPDAPARRLLRIAPDSWAAGGTGR